MINAAEAHKLAAQVKNDELTDIYNEIDNHIQENISTGKFSYTTRIFSKEMQKTISAHYEDLGYTIDCFKNGMMGINW